jgi:hypothetical protein
MLLTLDGEEEMGCRVGDSLGSNVIGDLVGD